MSKNFLLALILTFIFFVISFLTLGDYGISWDETIHFYRGQAYLHYFLTGETNYAGLPQVNLQGTNGDPQKITIPRRSFYQNDLYNGEYFLKNDSGHPPLNGELAALSNYIFYQKLGFLGDVQSHHLFNILAGSILVFVVVAFAKTYFGFFAALVSFLALTTYPLFWAESHFNIKDPPETAFFATAIWAFINSIQKASLSWLILFWIFLGLALGTKLNILFVPLILIPYLLFYYRKSIFSRKFSLRKIPKIYLGGLILGPMITLGIFLGSWPYLWQKWPENLINILKFYREIGTNTHYQPDNFFILGFNTFPLQWILYTTPPIVLVLIFIGLISVFINKGGPKFIGLLLILWFIVPLLRVSIPDSSIYGGVRQIMEFIPALALLAGLGAWQIVKWCHKKYVIIIAQIIIILLFIWPIVILVKLHPNENVYFNNLIGGLFGASERNFPSWGNSFGNAYFQGIKWINKNAEYGSKLSLIQGTSTNAPAIFLRSDIDYKSGNWSGINREGEYLMELTFNDTNRDFNYAWDYVENFLNPVYELKVDGVSILKIWKNDLQHTKKLKQKNEIEFLDSFNVDVKENLIKVNLNKEVSISRIILNFDPLPDCLIPKAAFVETSNDGLNWIREKDPIPFRQIKQKDNMTDNKIEYFVAGKEARYVNFVFENKNACPLNYTSIKILVLE